MSRKRACTPSSIQWHVAAVAGMAVKCARVAELEAELRHYKTLIAAHEEFFRTCGTCHLPYFDGDDIVNCDLCGKWVCLNCEPGCRQPTCCGKRWWCERCVPLARRCYQAGCTNDVCVPCFFIKGPGCPDHRKEKLK